MKLSVLFQKFCGLHHLLRISAMNYGNANFREDHYLLVASIEELKNKIAEAIAENDQELILDDLMPCTREFFKEV